MSIERAPLIAGRRKGAIATRFPWFLPTAIRPFLISYLVQDNIRKTFAQSFFSNDFLDHHGGAAWLDRWPGMSKERFDPPALAHLRERNLPAKMAKRRHSQSDIIGCSTATRELNMRLSHQEFEKLVFVGKALVDSLSESDIQRWVHREPKLAAAAEDRRQAWITDDDDRIVEAGDKLRNTLELRETHDEPND